MFQRHKATLTLVLALVLVPIATGFGQNTLAPIPPIEKLPCFGFAFGYKPGPPEMRIGVCSVLPDGPAQASGLRPDDSITAVDGKRNFKTAYEVLGYISQKPAGSLLKLDVVRDGTALSMSIVAAQANEAQQARTKRNLEMLKAEQELSRKRE